MKCISSLKKLLVNFLRWNCTGFFTFFYLSYSRNINKTGRLITQLKKDNNSTHNNHIRHKENLTSSSNNILFTIHWYDLGGAESFALKTIKLAKESGMTVHVISTVDSKNEDYELFAQYADTTIIGGSDINDLFLCKYIIDNKIDILHIHHSKTAYKALPLIKSSRSQIIIIDSLHIIEYRNGGFPGLAKTYDKYISIHNVASNLIMKYLFASSLDNEILKRKCFLTYLLPDDFQPLAETNPVHKAKLYNKPDIKLLFFSRIENQKQPYLFCKIIERLNRYSKRRALPLSFKGIIVGDGSMSHILLKKQYRMFERGELQFLGRNDDKDFVFSLADILIITSRNEGITLTSFEAISRGVPVVSTDVGAQSELLPQEMLVDTASIDLIGKFAKTILRLVNNQELLNYSIHLAQTRMRSLNQFSAENSRILTLYSITS